MKEIVETEGVVLRSMKYSESSVIVDIYTPDFGLKAFIINGVRSSKSKHGAAIFSVMNLVKISFYNRDNDALIRLVSYSYLRLYSTITTDVLKACIGVFIAEWTRNSIKEKDSFPDLYAFIKVSYLELDQNALNALPNFYLRYILNLTKFLGFYPHNNFSRELQFFDMIHGDFANRIIETKYSMSLENSLLLHQLMIEDNIPISRPQRESLLDELVIYYKLHIDNFKDLKSLPVLREIMS